jgi:hypothetical protein
MNVDEQGCPSWCIEKHRDPEVISHEGVVHCVDLLGGGNDRQFLEIRTVQYLPIDTRESSSNAPSMVEIAYHFGSRYRVLNLTGASARELAHVLLANAEALDGNQPTCEVY